MTVDGNRWRRDIDELQDTLLAASKERRKRNDFDQATGELGWVLYERNAMHDAVNRLRAREGKQPVERTDIERAETSASGHSDYVMKFAIRCADLVHERA